MLISNLFVRHKVPQPRFAPTLFIGLLAIFILLGNSKPAVGLAGIGATSVIAAVLVELNRVRIWETYRKAYRKSQGMKGIWTKPSDIYYIINVIILWPLIFVLGALCLYAAYMVG
jgi:hypothetical protein